MNAYQPRDNHVCTRCNAAHMSHSELRVHLAMAHNVTARLPMCGALTLALYRQPQPH